MGHASKPPQEDADDTAYQQIIKKLVAADGKGSAGHTGSTQSTSPAKTPRSIAIDRLYRWTDWPELGELERVGHSSEIVEKSFPPPLALDVSLLRSYRFRSWMVNLLWELVV